PRTADSFAHDIAGRTTFGLLRENGLHLIVIDHRYGVAALALCDAVDASRKVRSVFGSIRGPGYFWLVRGKARESVFAAGDLHPFLREQGSGNRKQQDYRKETCEAHIRFLHRPAVACLYIRRRRLST